MGKKSACNSETYFLTSTGSPRAMLVDLEAQELMDRLDGFRTSRYDPHLRAVTLVDADRVTRTTR